jgi:hypothetical protein
MQRSNTITVVVVAVIGVVITALFGILAWGDWVALQNQRRVIAGGIEAHAELKGTREVRTRGDTRYLVNAAWKDRRGAIRAMNGVNVTKPFFQEVVAGRKSATLIYLPAEPTMQPVFVDDAAALERDRFSRIKGRFVALLVGFAAGGLVLWGWRRRTAAAPRP